jgi:dTDP-4-dehydrorhamnose reductase
MLGRRILLTGAGGTLGRAIGAIFREGFTIVPMKREDLDLTNLREIKSAVMRREPEVILHTAAMTNVDQCEKEPHLAYTVNWIATKLIADAARTLRIPMIYISTDYVFGEEQERYREWDHPSPLSVYGKSKLFGEREVLNLVQEPYVVRTSWVFGPGGKNFFSKIVDYLKSGKLRAVSDQRSAPTYAPYLASALMNLIEDPPPPGIYHLPGEESASPLEFALHAREILGISVPVEAVTWQELKKPAQRPSSSILENTLLKELKGIFVPGWRQALKEFLGQWT